jgi:hypothetical protein
MPEDGEREVELSVRQERLRGQVVEWLRESVKLCYLFGGLWVGAKHTPRGMLILRAEETLSAELSAWYLSLPTDQRSQVQLEHVPDPYQERETRV